MVAQVLSSKTPHWAKICKEWLCARTSFLNIFFSPKLPTFPPCRFLLDTHQGNLFPRCRKTTYTCVHFHRRVTAWAQNGPSEEALAGEMNLICQEPGRCKEEAIQFELWLTQTWCVIIGHEAKKFETYAFITEHRSTCWDACQSMSTPTVMRARWPSLSGISSSSRINYYLKPWARVKAYNEIFISYFSFQAAYSYWKQITHNHSPRLPMPSFTSIGDTWSDMDLPLTTSQKTKTFPVISCPPCVFWTC